MTSSRTAKSGVKTAPRKSAARDASTERVARSAAPTARPVSVEQRAYEIFTKRVSTGSSGTELSDWLQAESELRSDEE